MFLQFAIFEGDLEMGISLNIGLFHYKKDSRHIFWSYQQSFLFLPEQPIQF